MKKITALLLSLITACSMLLSLASCGEGEEPKSDPTEASYIKISDKNITLADIGKDYILTCEVGPDTAEDKTVSWESSDESIATVENGRVVAVGYGVCVIKAKTVTGYGSACVVMVENPNPDITVSHKSLLFEAPKQSITLKAFDSQGNDISEDISWITSNRSVATVYYGEVITTGYGICTIRAVAKNGSSASCFIKVEDPEAPALVMSRELVEFNYIGEYTALEAVPSGKNIQVEYISSNPKVAIYKAGRVHAVGEGECAIIAVANNGLTAAAAVRVGKSENVPPPAHIMRFAVKGVPSTVKYIDTHTGEIATASVITSYSAKYEEIGENVIVTLTLNCVKIYDRLGEDGKTACILTTELYDAESTNVLIADSYTANGYAVGDSYSITVKQFAVAKRNGEVRELYLVLPDMTEQ